MHNQSTCIVVVLLLLLFTLTYGAIQDPISTTGATFEQTSRDHNVNPVGNNFWGPNYKRPYPTNTWWINLIMSGNNPIKTYPYLLRASDRGYHVCYPGRTVANNFIFESFMDNIIVGAREAIGTRRVMSHDDLSVTVNYSNGGRTMSSPILRGQVYHTVEYSGFTPSLTTIHAITGMNGGGLGTYTGTKLKLAFNNGQTWLVYTSSPVTWTVSGNTANANGAFTGTLRVVYMMNANQETVFDTYSSGYPTSGTTVYSVANNVATIRFQYPKKGSSQLLMFALPHHRDILTNPRYASPEIKYRSIKGDVVAVIGDEWVMSEPVVSDIGFDSRYTVPSGNTAALRAQLQKDQNSYPGPTDPYFGGKAVARLGRLAVIADELGETAIASKIRTNMKNYFNNWLGLGATSANRLQYERSYGGLVSRNSVGSSGADFGNYYYNDHHFHYGYFVYAAACIIKKDVAWGNTHKTKILEIVRDFANPSNSDPSYTKLRNKDWYTGHSFAAGLFAFADSRNQESTSEAVNAYYGVYTLGLAYNDADLRDLGRVLLQTEIRSAQKYWQITSADNIYDAQFAQNKVVGVLWETKVDYATFFGNNVEFIHGIQMLPFIPISEDFIRPNWVREAYEVFKSAYTRGNAAQGWLGILYQAQATFDKPGATSRIATLNGVDDGNTMTNTLYWLYTRPDGSNQKRSNPFANIDAYTSPPPTNPPPTNPPPTNPPPTNPPPTNPPPTNPPPTNPPPTNPPPSGCTSCGTYGTAACGTTCYNTDKYKCCSGTIAKIEDPPCLSVDPPPTNPPPTNPPPSTDARCVNVRCATGYQCCNGACYSPSIYKCADGMLCPSTTERCGNACYNPQIFKCCSGNALRPVGASC